MFCIALHSSVIRKDNDIVQSDLHSTTFRAKRDKCQFGWHFRIEMYTKDFYPCNHVVVVYPKTLVVS